MPLLRKGVVMPVKGIDFSQPATFIDDQAGFPTNMRYWRNELRKRPGKKVLNEVIADATQIMGIAKLEMGSGSKYLVRASKYKLERLNTTTNAWEVISVSDFSGGDDNQFHFTTVTESEYLIITNGYDNIRKWIGSGNDSALGGSPPKAKYLCYLSPYLLLAHTNDGSNIEPWKVQWCDTDDPTNWTTGNSGAALLSDEPSPIQNIIKLNEYVATYKKESLWLGRKVETAEVFKFDCIKTGIGLAASKAVADAEGRHYFMGLNDFYVWNGIREESIGGKVSDYIFSRIDRSKIARSHALHVQELNEIWFFLITPGNSWPNEVWKYNYRMGFWYMDTCAGITAALKWEKTLTESWDDDSGTWDAATDIWDAATSIESWENIVFGDSSGYCHELDYVSTDDNGVAVDAFFTTKDFIGDTLEFNKRWLRLDVWARGVGTLTVDYSIDEGDTWVNIPYNSSTTGLELDGTYKKYELYFDVWADKIRFRFRNAVSGETFYIRQFYPYYLVREEIQDAR